MKFRLMTYNIHKGIGGLDRLYRPERIIEVVANYDPDLLVLQEVDDGVPRSRRDCQVDLLGDALDYRHRAFQRNVELTHGSYGNAILSRFPLTDVHHLDLSIPLKKRRRALVTHVRLRWEHHSRTILVYNVHLGLAGFERTIQLRRILSHDSLVHTHKGTPVIITGDFNDVWGRLGKRLLEPEGFQAAHGDLKTFPAYVPLRPLDRVYFRGAIQHRHSFASHSKIARQASDHRPIIADFEVH